MTTFRALKKNKHFVGLLEYLWQLRWWLAAILFIVMLGLEVYEHWPIQLNGIAPDFLTEFLFFSLGAYLSLGFAISLTARTRKKWLTRLQYSDHLQEITKSITATESWDELSVQLVQLIDRILPIAGASLWLYNPDTTLFEYKAGSASAGELTASFSSDPAVSLNCSYVREHAPLLSGMAPCLCSLRSAATNSTSKYCLPLVHSGVPLAMFRIILKPGATFAREEVQFLNDLAPAMALAIHALQPQTSTALNAKIAEIERRNISRFLHGTLSQDLAVLQIKLDQLMHNIDRLADTASAQHELEGIQSIADQTCRQIRSLMADLHGNPSADLTATLIEYANQISQRAHFQLQITHEGEPRSLASQVQRQIFYLFQEALINIEKHARAQRVVITIAWTNDCFNLTVLDDGQGFDMDVVRDGTDHYGMTVIKEITEELIGILRLESAPQMGTRITFTLPLQKVSEGGLDVSVDSYQPSYS